VVDKRPTLAAKLTSPSWSSQPVSKPLSYEIHLKSMAPKSIGLGPLEVRLKAVAP
jgi:hypothetical protein